ncbi:MAG: hypothetical protein J6Y26_03095 [Lachnospiraceae bacterium]|nr:hypothetical protein [Lachnospiraceae bacterium]
MTKNEFITTIENAMDYVQFNVSGRSFTIITWVEEGYSIGEANKPDTVSNYESVTDMLSQYQIGGKSLMECIPEISIYSVT